MLNEVVYIVTIIVLLTVKSAARTPATPTAAELRLI
jgi:hypothetical protein